MSDWLGLRDKVCVVTGAASGIGRGIVLAFAAAGSKVVQEPDGCARTADEVKRRGATAMPLFCDVTERRPGRRQCGRGGRRGLAYRKTRRMTGLTDGHPSFVLQTPSPRPSR